MTFSYTIYRGKRSKGKTACNARNEERKREAEARRAAPAPDPGGLGGQQQIEGEAAGPEAAMEAVVGRAATELEGEAQARGPGN